MVNAGNIAFYLINRVITVIKLYFMFRLITRQPVFNAFYATYIPALYFVIRQKILIHNHIDFCIFKKSIKMSLGQVLRSTFQ